MARSSWLRSLSFWQPRKGSGRRPRSGHAAPLRSARLRLERLEERLALSSVFWQGGGGDWNDSSHWSSNSVPGSGDDVEIKSSTPITVTIGAFVHAIANSLTTDDGVTLDLHYTGVSAASLCLASESDIWGLHLPWTTSLSGSGTVNIYGTFTWNGGTMSGAGVTNVYGAMDISDNVTLNGRTLNNYGPANWLGSGSQIHLVNGAIWNNMESGTLDCRGDAQTMFDAYTFFNNLLPSSFNNYGILKKSEGTNPYGPLGIQPQFDNKGTIDVECGTLTFGNGNYDFPNSTLVHLVNYTGDGTTLKGGKFIVKGKLVLPYAFFGPYAGPILIATNDADLTLVGPSALVCNPWSPTTNVLNLTSNKGTLTLKEGCLLSQNTDFVNSGTVAIDQSSSLTVNKYTQTSSGELDVYIAGTQAGQYGQLKVQGVQDAGNLDGGLTALVVKPFSPAVGDPSLLVVSCTSLNQTEFSTCTSRYSDGTDLGSAPHLYDKYDSAGVSLVADQAISISPSSLPDWTAGQDYKQTISATGGDGNLTLAVVDSTKLPPGLNLNAASGDLSGTPTTPGNYEFTIKATDGLGVAASQTYTLIINPAPTITTTELPAGTVGQAYSGTVVVSGGTKPLNFSAPPETLPPGLSLGGDGVISGVPSMPGIYTFRVMATDAAGAEATATFTIPVAGVPSLLVDTFEEQSNPYDGRTSLCEAIAYANTLNGSSTITFVDEMLSDGGVPIPFRGIFTLTRPLPDLSADITIQGNGFPLTVERAATAHAFFPVFTVHFGATVKVSGLTISGGKTLDLGHGGGIDNAGSLHLENCTLSDNSASYGGGIYNNGSLTVVNCTLSGNSASYGGGIYNTSFGTLTVTSSTLSGNSASNSGSGLDNHGTLMSMTSSIVAGNSGASDLSGWNDPGNNYNLTAGDPLLAPLGYHGHDSPTPTMALLPGSPAIDNGDPNAPATDQRGVSRVGMPDIGAFESRGFTIALISGNNESALVNEVFPPLVVEVSSAFNEPVEGGQVTFTAPSSGASAILSGTPAAIGTDGQASATATANDTAGSYTVSATAAGSANTVNFELTNTLLPGRTPKGTNIQVKPIDPLTGSTPVSVTFPSVTQEGMTSLEITSIGLPPPAGFKAGVPSNYYNVSTTAEFTGPVTLAINYAGITFLERADLPSPLPKGFHLEDGVWVDRTSTTDQANKIVYVSVSSLSPFALFAEKLTPTVSVTDAGGTYNGSPYGATAATVTGAAGDILASFGDDSLSYTYYQGTTPLSNAPTTPGSYSVVAHYAGNDDYDAADSVRVTFTITPAPLTITANNQTKITHEANPTFTVSYSGFVLGEGPSVLVGTLTFATPATTSSPPGTYAITPSGLTSSNYAITFNSGTLTVLSYSQATTNLKATVDAAGLAPGIQNSLDSQLQAAIASFNRGNTKAGVNQLGAFINHVSAQRGKKIAAALADDLIASAQGIINAAL